MALPAKRLQSAMGMLSCAWHIATGGRQAELFRWRGTDSGVDGVSAGNSKPPPVWTLGLAGADVLRAFQQQQGTGWHMTNWHAKVIQLLFELNTGQICFWVVLQHICLNMSLPL
jgi:hypothetical protein